MVVVLVEEEEGMEVPVCWMRDTVAAVVATICTYSEAMCEGLNGLLRRLGHLARSVWFPLSLVKHYRQHSCQG